MGRIACGLIVLSILAHQRRLADFRRNVHKIVLANPLEIPPFLRDIRSLLSLNSSNDCKGLTFLGSNFCPCFKGLTQLKNPAFRKFERFRKNFVTCENLALNPDIDTGSGGDRSIICKQLMTDILVMY